MKTPFWIMYETTETGWREKFTAKLSAKDSKDKYHSCLQLPMMVIIICISQITTKFK